MYAACSVAGVEVEFAHTTVTDRETEGTSLATSGAQIAEHPVYDESRYAAGLRYADPIPETDVWGESRWGQGVWGGTIRETLTLDESRLDFAVLAADNVP